MTISVFSFTEFGGVAVPKPIHPATPEYLPFVTYVREDDDYETLERRIADHTGDQENNLLLVLIVGDRLVQDFNNGPTLWKSIVSHCGHVVPRPDLNNERPVRMETMIQIGIQRDVRG